MSRLSHYRTPVQRADIAAEYRSRKSDPLHVLGDLYHPPKIFEHGRYTLVADLPAVGEGGQAARLFEARIPAVVCAIEAGDCRLTWGGKTTEEVLVAGAIALAIASGNLHLTLTDAQESDEDLCRSFVEAIATQDGDSLEDRLAMLVRLSRHIETLMLAIEQQQHQLQILRNLTKGPR